MTHIVHVLVRINDNDQVSIRGERVRKGRRRKGILFLNLVEYGAQVVILFLIRLLN